MLDAETPRFRVSNEGDPIPPVDPENLKRTWNTRKRRLTCDATRAAQGQEADRVAVSHRFRMVSMLAEAFKHGQLLAPWKHGEELDDAVFRVAATFPIRPLHQHTYMLPGDSRYGFDPNAFVEKLIEETGVPHTWEQVPAKIAEGSNSCSFRTIRVGQGQPDPARQDARELLWAVWTKCQPNLCRASGNHEFQVVTVAWRFADFVIDNIHLAREFVSGGHRLAIVSQLERNAVFRDHLECSVCQRLMREHSDEEMARCRQEVPPGTRLYRDRHS